MAYLIGEDRYQISFIAKSLGELVDEDNPVRVVDLYDKGFVLYFC